MAAAQPLVFLLRLVHYNIEVSLSARQNNEMCIRSARFRYAAHAYINIGNFIPCGIVCNTALRQTEYFLEYTYRLRCFCTVNTVRRNLRNRRIVLCNPVQLLLELSDFIAGRSDCQIVSGPGRGDAGHTDRRIDIHIASVVITNNFYR